MTTPLDIGFQWAIYCKSKFQLHEPVEIIRYLGDLVVVRLGTQTQYQLCEFRDFVPMDFDVSRYDSKRSDKLAALENGGVDNWPHYSESLKEWVEMQGLPEDYFWG